MPPTCCSTLAWLEVSGHENVDGQSAKQPVDSRRVVPTPDELSQILFQAWRNGPGLEHALTLVRVVPVPGSVGLRGRFHLLTDGRELDEDSESRLGQAEQELFDTEWHTWSRQVELTDLADSHLVAHRLPEARDAAQKLLDSAEPHRHPLPRIDALVALGDAALQGDDVEAAIGFYDSALREASMSGYRFGRLRALVPFSYLTLRVASAQEAAARFREAAELAAELDERVYRANALVGEGEALARLGQIDDAERVLIEGLELFTTIRSSGGVVNAAQHLGDLLRRQRRWDQAETQLMLAYETARTSGPLLGVINAADALGEVHLARGDLSEAVTFHEIALETAEQYDDVRGVAHALNGLGRCAAADGDWDNAITLHEAAARRYRSLGDPLSEATALDGVARAAAGSGDGPAASRTFASAVVCVESQRSAQDRHSSQTELRQRFDPLYANALAAAVAAEDPVSFVVVFEALAGRRLAALVERSVDATAAQLSGQMLARSHQLPVDGQDLSPHLERAARLARLLGRVASRHGLPEIVRRELDDTVAHLYTQMTPEAATELLDVTRRVHIVLLTPVPGRSAFALLSAGPDTRPMMRLFDVSPATSELLETLSLHGLQPGDRRGDVAALDELLPVAVADALPVDVPVVLVPLGPLWSVPWPAVQDGRGVFLGEKHLLSLAPSLTLAAHALGSIPPARPRRVATYRSPEIRFHELDAFVDDNRVHLLRIDHAVDVIPAMVDASHDLVVVAGHGRPAPEIGQYLKLDAETLLTPLDVLSARPPALAALISCWGAAVPDAPTGDPMTIATILLARGCRSVLASTAEVADSATASRFVNDILHSLVEAPMAEAVRRATRRLLSRDDIRDADLSWWAPIVTVGSP